MDTPKAFEIYKHFKGNLYQVLCIATNSENGEKEVVYQALYEPFEIYVRPMELFVSDVDFAKYPNCIQTKRFEKVESGSEQEKAETEITEEANEDVKVTTEEKEVSVVATTEESADNSKINPVLLQFLEAEGYEEQLEVLQLIKDSLTPEILTPIELSLGMEPSEESVNERYRNIKTSIQIKQKYERQRP